VLLLANVTGIGAKNGAEDSAENAIIGWIGYSE
jgi:hypothetical protein